MNYFISLLFFLSMSLNAMSLEELNRELTSLANQLEKTLPLEHLQLFLVVIYRNQYHILQGL